MLALAELRKHSVGDAVAAVDRIDLGSINEKLTAAGPASWTREDARDAEANYRRFLALHLINPSEVLVPNEIVDSYWHQHILDTNQYAKDCDKIFGFFLHHDPYFGIRGPEDREQNAKAFAVTRQLWQEAFGVPMLGQSNPCSSTDCR